MRVLQRSRLRPAAPVVAVVAALALAACAPVEEDADTADEPTGTASAEPSESADACATDSLPLTSPGTLTVGTDSPAYEPWFQDNDPTNGEGFESAVAYAVAEELGFAEDQVEWVKVPFNSSYAPGPKNFDFDINQISITPERAEVVDFSDGYYTAAQALVALEDSAAGQATSIADLEDLELSAQTGTTSLTVLREVIQPGRTINPFEDTNQAKQALNNGQIDGFLVDLPTAFYITAVEIPKATIVGQFQPEGGEPEQFGLLFEKGNELVGCVDQALASLKESGELADLEQQWLSDVVDVPVLR
jgi:polar amino acid transport system substrate-binding protein